MIVKNESALIERCLTSVLPHIQSWAICDTGSTDGTQDIVRKTLAALPGELIERPWIDFATNRNQALELARRYGDYALMIDADDVLEVDDGFSSTHLNAPGYALKILDKRLVYWRDALPRLDQDWVWKGVVHEALDASCLAAVRKLEGMRIRRLGGGARSQDGKTEKFLRDAELLREGLKKEPDNARYAFYLAQSLRDAGRSEEAIDAYRHRIAMGGWIEEVYYSRFMIAALKERIDAPYSEIVDAYLDAYDFRPQRAETPCELARFFCKHRRFTLARDFARIACVTRLPKDNLLIDPSAYAWRPRNELATALYQLRDFIGCAQACSEMLADPTLPQNEHERIRRNLDRAMADAAALSGPKSS